MQDNPTMWVTNINIFIKKLKLKLKTHTCAKKVKHTQYFHKTL